MEESQTTSALCSSCQEYLDGWKHALADYDNLKKELAKEKEKMHALTKEDMVFQLLPVLDHFTQALQHEPEDLSSHAKQWVQGVLHIRRQLEEVLKEFGVETYGVMGEIFDPNLHEAIEQKREKEKMDGEILDVQQQGWRLGDRVLRPARVVVNHLIASTTDASSSSFEK